MCPSFGIFVFFSKIHIQNPPNLTSGVTEVTTSKVGMTKNGENLRKMDSYFNGAMNKKKPGWLGIIGDDILPMVYRASNNL